MRKYKIKKLHFFQRKICSTSGETIAETLVTMIVLSLAVLMLAGAVVTSAKVNKKAENTDILRHLFFLGSALFCFLFSISVSEV